MKKDELIEYLQYWPVKLLVELIRRLPLKGALRLGKALGQIWYLSDFKHRQVARDNLRMVFPEKPLWEINRIARESFEEFIRTMMVLCQMPNINEKRLTELVSFDPECFERAERSKNGLIFVTGHLGCWELLTICFHHFGGGKCHIVILPPKNRFIEDLITKYRNSFTDDRFIHKRKAGREVLKAARAGGIIGMFVDQNVSKLSEGVFVDFLGVVASTTLSPAKVSARTGIPVVPVFVIRDGDAHYRFHYGDEIPIQNSDDKQEDIRVNTQRITDALSQKIYQFPGQWFWVHRRWKTRPPL